MSDKKKAPSDPAELRRRAVEKLSEKTSASTPSEEADVRKLLHELQVHQIELEMQNEELHTAQLELETSRDRYADLYDFAPVGYCTINAEGIILEANLTAATMLGVVRSQLVGKPITRFIFKDEQDIYYLHRKDLLETGEPHSSELRMIKSDGSEFWVNLSASAEQDPDGVAGCRVVMSDITKRKQAEELFQVQSKFLETLLDSIPSPVFYKDIDGRYLGCNRSFEAIVGRKRQEIVGKTVYEAWPDRYADTYREKDLELIENPGKQQYESQLLSANGEERDTIFYKSTFANLDGSVGGIVGVMLDITERKRAETEVARSEKKYRTLLEAAFDLIYVIGRDDTVLYVNPAGSKLLGKPPEEIISKPRASFFPPEVAANQKIALDRVFASGEPFYREQENLQNEHVQWQETQLIPLKISDGSVESVLGISRDISERKQAEEQFRTIFTMSLDLICIASIETSTFTKINPAFSRLLGYTEAELLGKPFLEFIHPDDVEPTQRVVEEQLRAGKTVLHFENRYRTAGGDYCWLDWNSHPNAENGVTFAIARNITDKKRSEELIKQYRRELELTLEATTDGIWKWNFINDELEFSPQYYTMLGYEQNEFPADFENWKALIHPDDLNETLRGAAEYLKTKADVYDNEFRMRTKCGDYRWILAHAKVVERDKNGEAVRMIGNHQDVTERKQAEEELKAAEARTRSILSSIADTFYSLDKEWRFVAVNPAAEKAPFGRPASELLGKVIWDLYPGLVDTPIHRRYLDAKNNSSLEHYEAQSPLDGHWYEVFMQGWSGGVDVYMRDITERRQFEESLSESQRRLDLAIRSIGAGVWDWDVLNNRMIWDERMLELYGLQPEAFPGGVKAWENGLHPEDRARAIAECESALRGEKPFNTDFRIKTPAGEIRHIKADGAVLRDQEGTAVRMIGLNHDITERRRAEEERSRLEDQLQQAMKMEAVGRLAGGVAHDFNNLLTSITGNVQLSLMDLSPDDPLEGALTEIAQAADSAASLTRQLLAFSRKQLIEPKVLNLNELIVSLEKMLRRLIGEDIELKTIPGKRLGSIKADPGQLEQILVNLAVNARDAMPDGGKLIVETANAELDEEYCRLHPHSRPGAYVMLAVSDTGTGMSDEVKSHLFEPFFTTKPKERGTGLGLATIYGAVKQAGGSVEVYSEEGEGTTFKIYLPLVAQKAERLQAAAPAIDMPGGTETVLIVEDEKSVRDMAIRILKRLGYNVLQAPDGGQAFMLAEKYTDKIDLLVTDVIMPGMNGRQLAERLIQIHPEMKVLYTSGYTENAIAHHGVIDEGLQFIGKPYTPQALAKKLRDVLER